MDIEEIKQIAYDYTTCKEDCKKLENRILQMLVIGTGGGCAINGPVS